MVRPFGCTVSKQVFLKAMGLGDYLADWNKRTNVEAVPHISLADVKALNKHCYNQVHV